MSVNPPARLPILVLTGFLGSGKTTLLNRLLREWPRTAVLINEFGSMPVDQDLLNSQDLPLMTLSGGCLCCQVRGALAPVLRNLRMAWGKPGGDDFDRIILETSGVASPEPVLDVLTRDRWLAQRYALLGMVTTVAVPLALERLTHFPEAQAQVAWADTLVLTHTDLADAETLKAVESQLAQLAPTTPRLQAVHGVINPDDLLRAAATPYRRLPEGRDLPDHGFRSLSIHLDAPVVWERWQPLLAYLLAQHPTLVRMKGVVRRKDQPGAWAVQAASGQLYPLVALPPRADDDGIAGRLVFITAGPVDAVAAEMAAVLEGVTREGAIRWH